MSLLIPIGIDLGTSFCAVSSIDADGRTQMIRNSRGEVLTPSAVYFSDEQIVVGADALEAALRWPDRVAEDVKRDMGLSAYRRRIGEQEYPPEVIQSCILRQLRHDIVAAVGEDFQAVITVPAYFDESRRNATYDAAVMSGLDVLDIVNEPTAAALSFGERLGYLSPEGAARERLNVLVYDLGGGTFDVSVIRLDAAEIRTLATDGDFELGGLNWDQRLAEHVDSQFRRQCLPADEIIQVEQIALQRLARSVKHTLTERPLAVVEYGRGERQVRLSITRQEFEQMTADLLERTMFTTQQALQSAGLIWSDIDRLLLVGGASRMPGVRQNLRSLSGMEPDAEVNPDEAVARGAAIYARYLLGKHQSQAAVPKLRITDVNSHSLGLEGVNLGTLLAENVPLIPRNTPLPCEVKRTFVTRSDNQPNVKISLLEGESSVTAHCSKLATATIRHLPPGLPKGTPIDVRYSLQSSGRLAVRASIRGLGDDAHIELQRVSGLNDRKVQHWKKIVCRDGGYSDYKDALAHFFVSQSREVDEEELPDDEEELPDDVAAGLTPRRGVDLDAAVDFGAPQAAAELLQTHFSAIASRGSRMPPVESRAPDDDFGAEQPWPESTSYRATRRQRPILAFNLLGHIVAGLLGIVLGYFALCWVRPELNFFREEASGDVGSAGTEVRER